MSPEGEAMPPVCEEVPEAEEVLAEMQQATNGKIPENLSGSGYLALEVFAGCCVMTSGLLFQAVPAIKPWDAKYGESYNVFKQRGILLALAWGGWMSSAQLCKPKQHVCKMATVAIGRAAVGPARAVASPAGASRCRKSIGCVVRGVS